MEHQYLVPKEERERRAAAALVPTEPLLPPPGRQATKRPDVELDSETLREMKKDEKGSIDIYKAIIQKGGDLCFTPDELMSRALEREKCFAPRFNLVPTDLPLRERCHLRNMTRRKFDAWSDGWWCELCHKWADDMHAKSSGHIAKLDEQSALDEMVGPSFSARRFSNDPGCMKLSTRNFVSFWGERINDLPRILMDRLRCGHTIAIRWGGTPKMLKLSDIESVGLVAVSFKAMQSGKYNEGCVNQDFAVKWEALEDVADVPMDGEHFERLIGPDDEVKLANKTPEGHGWWPAVDVRWKGQHADFERDREGYFQAIASGDAPIWAPCGYQIWDGSNVVDAWPIRITRPSRL
jgi:hypothetical protein